MVHRRNFLAYLSSASLLAVSRTGHARSAAPRVPPLENAARDAYGTTLFLSLDSAPFAHEGYRDHTVIVFIPAHFRYRPDEGVSVLVHFHGHYTTAEQAMVTHQLREQLATTKQNALLVIPQLAVVAADSWCGKLEAPGGLADLLVEAIATAAHEGRTILGAASFAPNAPLGMVCLSAHSGGFHAAAACLRHGAVDVREAYLFDALYGDLDVFHEWVVAGAGQPLHRRRKLVSYSTEAGKTEIQNTDLRSRIERSPAVVVHERRGGVDDLSDGDALFVRASPRSSTDAWETTALRDVLFASALPRHLL